jgi:sec-independent protein translocase protein TatA
MGELSPMHWLVVALVAMLLFGAKRLPDSARALGRSMRILKSEMNGLHEDDAARSAAQPQAAPVAQPAPLPQTGPVAQPAPLPPVTQPPAAPPQA